MRLSMGGSLSGRGRPRPSPASGGTSRIRGIGRRSLRPPTPVVGTPGRSRMIAIRRALNAVLLASVACSPLEAQVGSPTLGAVFDPENRSVQAVLGIPGLARMGPSLDLGVPVLAAAYSPRRDYTVAATTDSVLLIVDDTGVRPMATLDTFSRVVLSPNGAWAALVDTTGRHLVVMSGLPEEPTLVVRTWLPAFYGAARSVAVSDQGLVLTAYADSGAVLALSSSATARRPAFRLVASFSRISAIGFVPERPDAIVADDATDTLYLVRGIEENTTVAIVADRNDGVDRPLAVAASEDGERYFVADAGARSVFIASGTSPATEIRCACAPSTLSPLQGNSVFVLSETGSDGVWVLNAGVDPPEIRPAPGAAGAR